MKKLNLNTAIAKRFCYKNASFLLFAQKKGAKKKAADFDAESSSLDFHSANPENYRDGGNWR